jgi:hypothetical protein
MTRVLQFYRKVTEVFEIPVARSCKVASNKYVVPDILQFFCVHITCRKFQVV